MKPSNATQSLRYLDADSVRFSQSTLAGFRVCTEDAESLGSVNGVLISPSTRQLRYFVIEKPGLFLQRRYLLAADTGATIDEDRKRLRIDARTSDLELEAFNARAVQEFSDNDLLETMFSRA